MVHIVFGVKSALRAIMDWPQRVGEYPHVYGKHILYMLLLLYGYGGWKQLNNVTKEAFESSWNCETREIPDTYRGMYVAWPGQAKGYTVDWIG